MSIRTVCMPAVVALLLAAPAVACENDARQEAGKILAAAEVQGGLVVHVGCGDGRLTAALRADERYLIHGLDTDAANVRRTRENILATGLYGSVSAAVFDGKRLPYADNMVNLLIGSRMGNLDMAEVTRVLAPGGVGYINRDGAWQKSVKPRPAEMDAWSHHLHDADGNPVAKDRLVGPPARLQWLAGPKWQRDHDTDANVNALVTDGRRVFYIVDEAPIGLPGPNGLPDRWVLAARDAFNGVLLWKVPVKKWGWREYKDTHYRTRHDIIPLNVHRRVVAAAGSVFATLGIGAPISRLDAASGKVVQRYDGTDGTREILFHDGQLILSVPDKNGLKLVVVNPETGKAAWSTSHAHAGSNNETGKLKVKKQPVLNPAADGDAVCFLDGVEIVCLDRSTGRERWRSKTSSKLPQLQVGTLIVTGGVVLYAERGILSAFSTRDGKELWTRNAKQPGGLWFSWKDIYVIDGLVWTWGPHPLLEAHGHDLKTGEVKKRVPLGSIFKVDHHHRCYRNKATSRFIIASRRGAEFVNLEGGPHSVNHWVRGICHLGMMPANGLLYAPPEPCKCYWYERVSDFCAFATSGAAAPSTATEPVAGPGRAPADGEAAGPEDWPTFRADPERSGFSKTRLEGQLKPEWKAALPGRLSAPIAVGSRVFVAAADAHTLYALEADSGRKLWHHTAGGRIDSPPSYVKGLIVFGSADGRVTCLRASDGERVWRFTAAPQERLVGVRSQLESAWPVHGSVLILDDTVYFAAGRSTYLDGGIHLYGLDLASGKPRHCAHLQRPALDLGKEDWYAGYRDIGGRGALADILQLAGGVICMRNHAFDRELRLTDAPPPARLQPMGGFLDDTYFKRYFWFYGTSMDTKLYASLAKREINEHQMSVALAQLLVRDPKALYGLRMYDCMKLLNANNYFVPGRDGYLVYKVAPGEGTPAWTQRVPVRAQAMAVTADRLVLAGPPDVVDPADPLGAFEARKGGVLRVLSTADGRTLEEHKFASPPAFNGVAVARGRVFVSLQDGTLTCLRATR